MKLDGKVAIITGAGSGMGRVIARAIDRLFKEPALARELWRSGAALLQ